MTDTDQILFETRGALGVATLNRPKALNALTMDMIQAFDHQLRLWQVDPWIKAVVVRGAGGRAFCAGGDVVHAWESGLAAKNGTGDRGWLARELFRAEYTLDRLTARFPKPYLALLDGYTMGGGVGISVHGSHRIATERTLFAMPETAIGIFPDVGGSWFLPRLPGQVGIWLGLTGARLGPADLVDLKIAQVLIPHQKLDAVIAELASVDWTGGRGDPYRVVDAVLARHAQSPAAPPLARHRAAIERCFRFDQMERIVQALAREGGSWAAEQLAMLNRMSPTSLKVTLRQLRQGARLDFDACLAMEYRLSQAVMAGHDFFEGVRALLVDKDKAPKWQPSSLEEVEDVLVADHFTPPGVRELCFDD